MYRLVNEQQKSAKVPDLAEIFPMTHVTNVSVLRPEVERPRSTCM